MKEKMGSEETNIPSKTSRRVSHQVHSVINGVADAGREIAYMSSPQPCVTEQEPNVKGNDSNDQIDDVSMFSDVKYCYYLLEAMPLAGPTWSTTAPSVLAEPPSPPIVASLGLECGENQASSHTWWLGFLEGLDDNMSIEKLELPFVENVVMENSKGLRSKFVDAIDLGCCPDDWLVIPTMEKDLGDLVMP